MTIDSFTKITIPVEQGQTIHFNLQKCGLMALTAFKAVGALMLMKWGCTGVRTFRPILQNLQKEQLAEFIDTVAVQPKPVAASGSKCCSKEPVPIK